ncbi:ABC transporter substrate-binding protein [Vibrio sp. TH_r3]|uniref:heme/hemin ABC transporter substrate-binding protein n=1 Tax=Vibrio sp. TH_r3 TaxID=3082084 RepID=UPI0029538E21|nr:ABC transporter substrate-binding protein [Vibrio sp. TH_r3]MDV7103970.1 ABC transporter substrate-binding protein [Vibrio sp. TH_r3]
MRLLLITFSFLFVHSSALAQERIISAGSAITELVYALEAEDQLVAVDTTSRYFVQGSDIPQVGYHRQLSAEGLLALDPSYLIGSEEMGPESTIDNLKATHVNVLTVPSGDSIEDLYQRIDIIADITGTTDKSAGLKKTVQQQMAILDSQHLTEPPKVMFMMLSKGRPVTVGGQETTIDKIITLSGALNPARDSVRSYKPLSIEAVIALQPDYILVSERAWKSLQGHQGIIDAFPLLAVTSANKPGRIISIPSHALIGGFGLESIQLSQQLHDKFNSDKQ